MKEAEGIEGRENQRKTLLEEDARGNKISGRSNYAVHLKLI